MNEAFNDYLMDSKLHIRTTGRDATHSDSHRYPYEPTTYSVLDRIVLSEYLDKTDCVLDYGCGKGRVSIYLHARLGCKGYGVELVEEFCNIAKQNAASNRCEDRVCFDVGRAERYLVPDDVTVCFFFNPFDLGIMRGVMTRILESYDKNPRRIRLFFYYPQDEYVAYLSTIPELDFVDEIDCMDLFTGMDTRNRVMIFEIN